MTEFQYPTQHTPGPWTHDMGYIVAPDPHGIHPDIYIAEIAAEDSEGRIASHEEQLANAALIAAAPELLKALMDIEIWITGYVPHNIEAEDYIEGVSYELNAVRRVIAKAQAQK